MKRVFLVSLMALAILGTSCKGKKAAAVQEQITDVKATTVQLTDIEQKEEFTATIDPYQKNNIAPAMVVRIDDITVKVGDRVRKGQPLVRMDQTQYRQSAIQLATLQSDFARAKALYAAGGMSKQQLDQLESQLYVAKESADMLKTNVELKSPLNGVVTGRYYDPGDVFSMSPSQASGTAAVLTVMEIDRLKVIANVSEQYFSQVKVGMPVDIALDIFPGKVFQGKTSLVYPSLDAKTRTFTVEIVIPNKSGELRPGMYARATINMGVKQGVLVPDVAVQKQAGSNEKYIFIVEGDVAHKLMVTVGRRVGDQLEITSGLTGGEQVVIAGASKLDDGEKVKIN